MIFKLVLKIAFALILIILIGLHLASPFIRIKDSKVDKKFSDSNVKYKIVKDTFDGNLIRYIQSGNEKSEYLVFFIHGSPGSWNDFNKYLKNSNIADKALMIAVDRLGYGYSDYGNAAGISKQAEFCESVINNHNKKKVILVGHSYGTAIAAKIASSLDQAVSLIMLAPVNDPDTEKYFTLAAPTYYSFTNWIFPGFIRVSGYEKIDHVDELNKMKEDWNSIKVPVYHLYCETDRITYAEPNVTFSKKMINKDLLQIIHRKGKDHFIPWNDVEFVTNLILNEIQGNKEQK